MTSGDTQSLLLDSKEVGKLLGCDKKTVERLGRIGTLPRGIKVGRLRKWTKQQILDWIAMQTQVTATPTQQ